MPIFDLIMLRLTNYRYRPRLKGPRGIKLGNLCLPQTKIKKTKHICLASQDEIKGGGLWRVTIVAALPQSIEKLFPRLKPASSSMRVSAKPYRHAQRHLLIYISRSIHLSICTPRSNWRESLFLETNLAQRPWRSLTKMILQTISLSKIESYYRQSAATHTPSHPNEFLMFCLCKKSTKKKENKKNRTSTASVREAKNKLWESKQQCIFSYKSKNYVSKLQAFPSATNLN